MNEGGGDREGRRPQAWIDGEAPRGRRHVPSEDAWRTCQGGGLWKVEVQLVGVGRRRATHEFPPLQRVIRPYRAIGCSDQHVKRWSGSD